MSDGKKDETFQFEQKNRNVLQSKKTVGRPKNAAPKKEKRLSCYLTDEEHEKALKFLDGRPASRVLKQLLLDAMQKGRL